MKNSSNYLGEGVDAQFLHQIRRAQTEGDFFGACHEFLDHDRPVKLEPVGENVDGFLASAKWEKGVPTAGKVFRLPPDYIINRRGLKLDFLWPSRRDRRDSR